MEPWKPDLRPGALSHPRFLFGDKHRQITTTLDHGLNLAAFCIDGVSNLSPSTTLSMHTLLSNIHFNNKGTRLSVLFAELYV